jgi:hypothetical protein
MAENTQPLKSGHWQPARALFDELLDLSLTVQDVCAIEPREIGLLEQNSIRRRLWRALGTAQGVLEEHAEAAGVEVGGLPWRSTGRAVDDPDPTVP